MNHSPPQGPGPCYDTPASPPLEISAAPAPLGPSVFLPSAGLIFELFTKNNRALPYSSASRPQGKRDAGSPMLCFLDAEPRTHSPTHTPLPRIKGRHFLFRAHGTANGRRRWSFMAGGGAKVLGFKNKTEKSGGHVFRVFFFFYTIDFFFSFFVCFSPPPRPLSF